MRSMRSHSSVSNGPRSNAAMASSICSALARPQSTMSTAGWERETR